MITLLSVLLPLGCETPTLSSIVHRDTSVESMDEVSTPSNETDFGLMIDDPLESGGEVFQNQDGLGDHGDHLGGDAGDADDDLMVNDRGDNLEVQDRAGEESEGDDKPQDDDSDDGAVGGSTFADIQGSGGDSGDDSNDDSGDDSNGDSNDDSNGNSNGASGDGFGNINVRPGVDSDGD